MYYYHPACLITVSLLLLMLFFRYNIFTFIAAIYPLLLPRVALLLIDLNGQQIYF